MDTRKVFGGTSRFRKKTGAPVMNLSESKLKEPTYIDKYRSFEGHIMW